MPNRTQSETLAEWPEEDASGTAELRAVGLVAGRYELLDVLGIGAMGKVYRVRDTTLDEVVALKVLRSQIARDPDALARFRSEVKLARRVTHVNVARTFDIGEDHGQLFLTMEYLAGDSLGARLLRESVVPVVEAERIAFQIVQGLMAAHAAGVVHRDLKPDNVMFDGDRVVLTDFGVARVLSHPSGARSQTMGILGTPAYMAPEQVEGRRDIDGRADYYALGVMLWEMLTGELPFKGESPAAVAVARLLREAPDLRAVNPNVPASVSRLVSRLLSRDRERRGTAEEIADCLKASGQHVWRAHAPLSSESTSSAPAPSSLARSSAPPSSRRISSAPRLDTPPSTAPRGPSSSPKLEVAPSSSRLSSTSSSPPSSSHHGASRSSAPAPSSSSRISLPSQGPSTSGVAPTIARTGPRVEGCIPYRGGKGAVIVYDTYTTDRAVHFDVLLPYEVAEGNESRLNRRALAAAKDFLTTFGLDPTWVTISGCSRCHIDELSRFGAQLWLLPNHAAWILPMDGCPKP